MGTGRARPFTEPGHLGRRRVRQAHCPGMPLLCEAEVTDRRGACPCGVIQRVAPTRQMWHVGFEPSPTWRWACGPRAGALATLPSRVRHPPPLLARQTKSAARRRPEAVLIAAQRPAPCGARPGTASRQQASRFQPQPAQVESSAWAPSSRPLPWAAVHQQGSHALQRRPLEPGAQRPDSAHRYPAPQGAGTWASVPAVRLSRMGGICSNASVVRSYEAAALTTSRADAHVPPNSGPWAPPAVRVVPACRGGAPQRHRGLETLAAVRLWTVPRAHWLRSIKRNHVEYWRTFLTASPCGGGTPVAICPFCGTALTAGTEFCAACGRPRPLDLSTVTLGGSWRRVVASCADGGIMWILLWILRMLGITLPAVFPEFSDATTSATTVVLVVLAYAIWLPVEMAGTPGMYAFRGG